MSFVCALFLQPNEWKNFDNIWHVAIKEGFFPLDIAKIDGNFHRIKTSDFVKIEWFNKFC